MTSALRKPAPSSIDLVEHLPEAFLLDPIPFDSEGRYSNPPCAVAGCSRESQRREIPLCRTDLAAFERQNLRLEQWLRERKRQRPHKLAGGFEVLAAGSRTVRNELALGLHERGKRGRTTLPAAVAALARSLRKHHVETLLDLRQNRIKIEEISRAAGGYRDLARGFLLDTLDALCVLSGVEPTRRYLGIASAGGAAYVNHNLITNPEFAASVERWMAYRINAEIGAPQYIQAIHGHVVTFCTWLDTQGVTRWSDLTRDHMLGFLGYVVSLEKRPGARYSAKHQNAILGAVNLFIDEATLNEWADIRRSARLLPNERPKIPASPPRLIGKDVIARLRHAGNLQLVADLDCRLIIRIAAETGLRRKDIAAGMTMDCVLDLGGGKWSIAYRDSKSGDMATAPINEELAVAIVEHIAHKQSKYPGTRNLFARDLSDRVITLTLVNASLTKLIEDLDIRGSDGEFLRVTPHMFRHQNATDWLESGMSIAAVQKLLGHKSMTTTQVYARLSEQKVRDEWERSRAVTNTGELVERPTGLMEEAAWTHAFLGGAAQALPNGRCGMPCGETCEHANACLYCPLFMTTPDYLPVLRDQRDDHAKMMELAEVEGHTRIVEKNRKPFLALTKLIASLEEIQRRDQGEAGVA
ncbi:site-specific integrase [Protaetiibacter sp. SSC-01]|uniref:tyrosine-type recombinase/integrase n=1 Tax=Protaetiibacter sp. SSC-01 TaxID=2759943 RepID=UPI0016571A12|nr:site-specific integrase [Protaetiibacter sp. SSC-01]QNO37960.1 site-specific integrase [Protaetiibacter sp. SSC-01]